MMLYILTGFCGLLVGYFLASMFFAAAREDECRICRSERRLEYLLKQKNEEIRKWFGK